MLWKSKLFANAACDCRHRRRRWKIQLSKCAQINNQNDLSSHSCFRCASLSLSLAHPFTFSRSVCWRSNFSSENYDMLPCVIPFRKYVYTLFFSRSNLHLSTSVLIILFFLHLLCHVCFWCRYWWVWCVRRFAGAVQMFIANFLIYFSHTLTLYYTTHASAYCIYLFTFTHSLTQRTITRYRYDGTHKIPSYITMVFVI